LKQELHSGDEGSGRLGKKPKRKRHQPILDETTKMVRSQKHNEAEVRRRQRLNNLLLELAELVYCRKPQKSAILRVTIEKVKNMDKRIQELEAALKKTQLQQNDEDEPHIKREDNASPDTTSEHLLSTGSSNHSSMSLEVSSHGSHSILTTSTSSGSSSESSPSLSITFHEPPVLPGLPSLSGMDGNSSSSSHSNNNNNTWSTGSVYEKQYELGSLSNPSFSASPVPLAIYPQRDPSILSTVSAMQQYDQQPASTAAASRSSVPVSVSSMSLQQSLGILHTSMVPMGVIDLNGAIIDVNTLFTQFSGYSRQHLLDPSHGGLFPITHPDSLNDNYNMLSQLISAPYTIQRCMKKYLTPSGMVKQALVTCWMLKDDEGKQSNYVCCLVEPVENTDPQGM
jgi:PAS domain S-box-containing protein